jgi:hypothetical protein
MAEPVPLAPATNVPAAAVPVALNVNAVSVPLPSEAAPVVKKTRVFKVAMAPTETKEETKEEPKEGVKVKVARKMKVVSESRPEAIKPEEEIGAFYKKRGKAKTFKHYSYTPEGNLIITDQEPPKTIALRKFRPLTDEELQKINEERGQKIIDTEQAFDKASDLLRKAYGRYKEGGSAADVVRVNKIVKAAEQQRNKAMFPERFITIEPNPEVRSIIFEQKYEQRKMGHDVFLLKYMPYSKKDLFGHYLAPEETKMDGGSDDGGSDDEHVITVMSTLIESPEDKDLGYLHPCYMKDFTYGGVTYAFPLQAFEVTRLKGLKQDSLVEEIMKTRSPRTVKNIAARDSTLAQNAYELWSAILKAFYQQHQDLAKKLEESGDNLFRLAENAPATSQYLKALFSLRASLRESQPTDVEVPVSTGGVITEEQQKRNKLAAIMRANKHY